MNIKVIYKSKKHTKKVAKAIAESLGVKEVLTTNAGSLADTDILFLCFGIYGGSAMADVLEFARTIHPVDVKKVVLVTTSARGTDQSESVRAILEQNHVIVGKEVFVGKGSFFWMNIGQPNEKTVNSGKEFAQKIIKNQR